MRLRGFLLIAINLLVALIFCFTQASFQKNELSFRNDGQDRTHWNSIENSHNKVHRINGGAEVNRKQLEQEVLHETFPRLHAARASERDVFSSDIDDGMLVEPASSNVVGQSELSGSSLLIKDNSRIFDQSHQASGDDETRKVINNQVPKLPQYRHQRHHHSYQHQDQHEHRYHDYDHHQQDQDHHHHRHHHHHHDHNHHPRQRNKVSNEHLAIDRRPNKVRRYISYSRPLVRNDRFWHNNRNSAAWCSRDCEELTSSSLQYSHENRSICASDGRLYKSMCELKRHSCRHNVHLRKKPRTFCLDDHVQMTTTTTTTTTPTISTSAGDDDQIRIVELKRRCDSIEYENMKHLMLEEFNGNVQSMFRYLDANADGYIEAHELWPRVQIDEVSNRLFYAQIWANHTNKCPRISNSKTDNTDNNNNNTSPTSNDGSSRNDNSKCWYFLDFTFQPQYPGNPCSLSHLILFDLELPSHRFDYDSFERAFSDDLIERKRKSSINNDNPEKAKLIPRTSSVDIGLGDTISLGCFDSQTWRTSSIGNVSATEVMEDNHLINEAIGDGKGSRCIWMRYNMNIANLKDPHISINSEQAIESRGTNEEEGEKSSSDITMILHIKEAQLYLSGQFKCVCHFNNKIAINYEHTFDIRVLAPPRVAVLPSFQWSLPSSRVSFECLYDQIDTTSQTTEQLKQAKERYNSGTTQTPSVDNDNSIQDGGQFKLKVRWLKDQQELTSQSDDQDSIEAQLFNTSIDTKELFDEDNRSEVSDLRSIASTNVQNHKCNTSSRGAITFAASRLTLENLEACDSGSYSCNVELPIRSNLDKSSTIGASDEGVLMVQDKPKEDITIPFKGIEKYLWIFDENGISVYKLQNDDGQEIELLREINGHNSINAEVDGNWNQLTLCGGLNTEQAVICEWSDNAVFVDISHGNGTLQKKYVYVGQPNLNRVVVFDSSKFEIVAMINTEPQPRKLHLYEPNKIHLSKWVKRRLSPIANARWKSAIGTQAHSHESTPFESRLYSLKQSFVGGPATETGSDVNEGPKLRSRRMASVSERIAPSLIQQDIWLLCYGQPLIVSPSGDEDVCLDDSLGKSHGGSLEAAADSASNKSRQWSESIVPFQPRLSMAGVGLPQFAWPANIWMSNNKEARLRNRKSVHIIQSTFFPTLHSSDGSMHNHADESPVIDDPVDVLEDDLKQTFKPERIGDSVVSEFKKSTVISTHYVYSGSRNSPSNTRFGELPIPRLSYLAGRGRYDLIQDLFVPQKPYSMKDNSEYKIHYAYVTHYDEQRLFRISMDDYRYDREVDLQDCDPINIITLAQGLIVIQCRTPISHNLIGQVVIDQLTNSRLEFNPNVRAQESYLSPDNRFLISIYHNNTSTDNYQAVDADISHHHKGQGPREIRDRNSSRAQNHPDSGPIQHHSSIVYVQTVITNGLRLQYEIKTLFEIYQCSFVWKDGYYAAIFVTTNRRERQSEILSLRLIDSRLELIARVPGLVSAARHKEQLIISPELRLAALTTNQGTFVIDLEENRISQSLRRHQSTPTLLWI